jgi:Golgi nucleoside diphosphatase
MPYINKNDRFRFLELVQDMRLADIKTAGELNYLLTQLTHSFLSQHDKSYQNYNDALGALEGCKLELYRQSIARYEDIKIELNGDVP